MAQMADTEVLRDRFARNSRYRCDSMAPSNAPMSILTMTSVSFDSNWNHVRLCFVVFSLAPMYLCLFLVQMHSMVMNRMRNLIAGIERNVKEKNDGDEYGMNDGHN